MGKRRRERARTAEDERRPPRPSKLRRDARHRAERGRWIAVGVFVLFAVAAVAAAVVWRDARHGLAAAGFAAGAALMLARPGIERRRTLGFAIPSGGAELVVLPAACVMSLVLIRLAQVTAGTDNPPIYLFASLACWVVSLVAAWSLSSLPLGQRP